jgi:hypothetical protein
MAIRGLLASAALGIEVGQCRDQRMGVHNERDRDRKRREGRLGVERERKMSGTSKNWGKGRGSRGCLPAFHCYDTSFVVARSSIMGSTEGRPRNPFLTSALSITTAG